MTGQPDFADIRISYIPDAKCVELKSLKLYLWSFRQTGAFHEDVTNTILDDLVLVLKPLALEVVGDFNIRGGIHTIVTASYPDELEGAEDCCGGSLCEAEEPKPRKGAKSRAGKKK
jgi:7-cyano-7-deazaguanine reductase